MSESAAVDRVLEIGGYAAGYCGRLFVQAGAEVVRWETQSPASAPPAWASATAMGVFLHAGKQRLQAGTGDSASQLAELAAAADVVICEAATADELTALGFDNWVTPVKVAITPFGRTGPKRNWQATPATILATGGYTYLMGDEDREPLNLPGHYLEFQAGGLGYTAANALRWARQSNSVDIGLLETTMALSQFTTVRWHCAGEIRTRHGSDFYFVSPSELYACKDGWVYVNIVPAFWDPFTVFIERPELAFDERFANNDLRIANRHELHEIVGAALAEVSCEEAAARAEACRVPAGVVQSFKEVLADPHLAERNFWQTVHTPEGDSLRVPGVSYRLNNQPTPTLALTAIEAAADSVQGDQPGKSAMMKGCTDASIDGPVDGPMNGVRILDLTHVWAGPLAVRFLADLGADVVKVESPLGRGPRTPPAEPLGGWIGGEPGAEPWNANALFVKLARNRDGLCVDLKNPEGRALFLELVAVADVVLENFSARAMPAFGLGWDVLREANPRLVYVTMPGYGASGPYSGRVAFGPAVEPQSGLTNVMGYGPDEPRNTALALLDPITGVNATAAVLTALRDRDRTGQGVLVEMSLHEGGVTYSGPWLIDEQLGHSAVAMGNAHPAMSPHGVYQCAGDDDWLVIACASQAHWRALCSVLIESQTRADLQPDWNLAERQHNRTLINTAIKQWSRAFTRHAAEALLQQAGVPAGAVNTAQDMAADTQVRAREFFVPYERFATPMPGNPIKMAGLDSTQWRPCPGLGADNAKVLEGWLGYDGQQIAALATSGVLASEPPG